MSKPTTVFVSGAAGQLGRQVVEFLVARNDKNLKIVAGSRSPEKLAAFKDQGVEVRHVDFDDVASLPAAFAGVDRLLIVSTDSLAVPGQRVKQHSAAVVAAKAAGVQHIVYTSAIKPDVDSPLGVAEDHRKSEEAVQASGLGYTILRNGLYMDFLPMKLGHAVKTGVLAAAAGEGKENWVTRRDCAAAAAGALASDFAGQRTLDVTGPAAHSFAELAAFTATATGKPVRYQPITKEEAVAGLVAGGVPAPMAAVLVSFDVNVALGRANVTTSTVKDLSGTAPVDIETFLASIKNALV